MSTILVRYESAQGIATLTLDHAPANGYSHAMMRQLDDGILKARFDPEVHVLILKGAGEKFFCAGADLSGLHGMDPATKYQFCLHANETLLRLEHTDKLVIAALNGHCVGGGLEIALACDLRIGREGGGKIGMPEVALGVLPGTGGTQRLARLLGKSRALEMMITGRTMSMEEGLSAGLLHHLFPSDSFEERITEFARSFCPPQRASMAVGLIKRSVQSGADLPLESGLTLERELQARLFASEDAKEGIRAFVEKERAQFKGR
ncbi:MAG TPA: enoyl-CoA hydratase/isomerase family protein [Planctomycetota bacterium]|jgi:enoyl-CoA hydratase/carnithine racemase|nr:enoyl-CoA hydratase/isomerase family protein [Planctomycetota bacterium]